MEYLPKSALQKCTWGCWNTHEQASEYTYTKVKTQIIASVFIMVLCRECFFLSLTNLYASCGQGKPYFKIRCISMKSHSIISADELFLQSIYLLFGFFEGVFYYKRKRSFLFLFKNISITKTQKNPDVCKFTTICSMCSHTRIIN